jgi:hypothetical protein
MTATVSLDEMLFAAAKQAAAARGQTFDEFVAEAVTAAVQNPATVRFSNRNGLIVIEPASDVPAIDPIRVRQLVEEGGS